MTNTTNKPTPAPERVTRKRLGQLVLTYSDMQDGEMRSVCEELLAARERIEQLENMVLDFLGSLTNTLGSHQKDCSNCKEEYARIEREYGVEKVVSEIWNTKKERMCDKYYSYRCNCNKKKEQPTDDQT